MKRMLKKINNSLSCEHDSILFTPCQVYNLEFRFRMRFEEVIDFFELGIYRWQFVVNLPFGMQKSVGMARAVAMEPKILLLDEPSADMVREEKENLARFLLRIKHELGLPIIWGEHDLRLVADICDRLVAFNEGRKIADGQPEQVLADPVVRVAYFGTRMVS